MSRPNDSSSPQQEASTHPAVLAVVVRRITPAGVIVVLPDGRTGVIRVRELAWDAQGDRNWTERVHPGDVLDAVIIGKRSSPLLELSMRYRQGDVWAELERRYPVGMVVCGVVTGVMPYGAFVELEPGITGLLHISHLPHWVEKPISDLFWLGDRVRVSIEGIDRVRRRIALSMRYLADRRWSDALKPAPPRPAPPGSSPPEPRSAIEMLVNHVALSVVVVEDDPDQRQAVTEWLLRAGQRVEAAANVSEALDIIDSTRTDLVLMDVGLPDVNGVEGAELLAAHWPGVRCVLMTDWGRAEQHAADLQRLNERGIALLIKPLLPEDLAGALLALPNRQPAANGAASAARASFETAGSAPSRAEHYALADTLAQVRSAARADKVAVFELDADSRQISVVDQAGRQVLHLNSLPELIHSPVRDVAEDGRVVIAQNYQEVAGRSFVHLKPLLDFETCIGVPVRTQLHNRYALFLFYSRPAPLTDLSVAQAEVAAASVGVWLEQRQLLLQMAALHRTALLGQLGRALVHEISGRLTPINLAIESLQTACNRIEGIAAADPARVAEEARQARSALHSLGGQAVALAKTTRSFSRMTRSGQEEILRLDDIVDEAIQILGDAAGMAHVKVVAQPAPRLLFTRAQVTFLQQVVVNVLQNAIQQIGQFRPKQGGRVEIRLAHCVSEGREMLQVHIEDDGPGIHRRLWERIFDMDYTTRPDGSGLGLYISRKLVEAQGGRLSIAASEVLWGTTFVIEVPYRV